MRSFALKPRWHAVVFALLAFVLLASVARSDVHVVLPGDAKCRIKVKPETPCGTPLNPANYFFRWPADYAIGECTPLQNWGGDPPNPRVYFSACYYGGDNVSVSAIAFNGACAGSAEQIQAPDALLASVGLYNPSDIGDPASMLRLHVERTVTPGPVPDIVTVTFLGGGLQTRVADANDQALSSLKLIIYPDQATADADSTLLTGAGSAFLGEVTLVGATGTLIPLLGFVASDFLLQDDGGGGFTATPISGLVKTALVPDANSAVVTTRGDPKTFTEPTVGVGDGANTLALAPVRPNPFAASVALRFSLPAPGPASLEVFDLLGRRVRSWHWDAMPAGEHSVNWDGRSAAGERVPAGAMLLRLTAMGRTITQKAMRLP